MLAPSTPKMCSDAVRGQVARRCGPPPCATRPLSPTSAASAGDPWAASPDNGFVQTPRDIAARNTRRPSAVSSVHAMATSQAGSPAPQLPKSMTAVSFPFVQQQVSAGDVAVEPARHPSHRASSAAPARFRRSGRRAGAGPARRRCAGCRPEPVVLARPGRAGEVDVLQRRRGPARSEGERDGSRTALRGRRFAVEPGYRPREGVVRAGIRLPPAGRRPAAAARARAPGPALFLVDGQGVFRPRGSRLEHRCRRRRRPVVPAAVRPGRACNPPLRGLLGDEPPHLVGGDLDAPGRRSRAHQAVTFASQSMWCA